MADSKISALSSGGLVQAGDNLVVARAGASLKVTPAGIPVLVYRYTVAGSDKASIDTGVDTAAAGSNDWTNCDLLEIFVSCRTDETGVASQVNLTFNNDTTANVYNVQWSRVIGTGASFVSSVTAAGIAWQAPGTTVADTSVPGTAALWVPNPTGTVLNKGVSGTFGFGDPGDSTSQELATISGAYRPASPAALTRLAIAPNTAGKKLKIGSQLLIYKRLAS